MTEIIIFLPKAEEAAFSLNSNSQIFSKDLDISEGGALSSQFDIAARDNAGIQLQGLDVNAMTVSDVMFEHSENLDFPINGIAERAYSTSFAVVDIPQGELDAMSMRGELSGISSQVMGEGGAVYGVYEYTGANGQSFQQVQDGYQGLIGDNDTINARGTNISFTNIDPKSGNILDSHDVMLDDDLRNMEQSLAGITASELHAAVEPAIDASVQEQAQKIMDDALAKARGVDIEADQNQQMQMVDHGVTAAPLTP